MGRNSGGVVRLGQNTAVAVKVQAVLPKSKSIDEIKDRAVVKELNRAISRYHAVLGVKERSIRMADLSGIGALGVTYIGPDGKSAGILLNEKFFDRKKGEVIKDVKQGYKTGFKSKTNAPLQHTVTHEFAHATWNASMTSRNAKAAGVEIKSLYKKWLGDRRKKGHGTYGAKNVSEFWAETVTKAIHGNSDKYTEKIIKIAKKYKL